MASLNQASCSGRPGNGTVEVFGLVIDRLRCANGGVQAAAVEGQNALQLLIQRTSDIVLIQKFIDIDIDIVPYSSNASTYDCFLQAAI